MLIISAFGASIHLTLEQRKETTKNHNTKGRVNDISRRKAHVLY
jgi:hypothetical protein